MLDFWGTDGDIGINELNFADSINELPALSIGESDILFSVPSDIDIAVNDVRAPGAVLPKGAVCANEPVVIDLSLLNTKGEAQQLARSETAFVSPSKGDAGAVVAKASNDPTKLEGGNSRST